VPQTLHEGELSEWTLMNFKLHIDDELDFAFNEKHPIYIKMKNLT
jgi:hypothetical protein